MTAETDPDPLSTRAEGDRGEPGDRKTQVPGDRSARGGGAHEYADLEEIGRGGMGAVLRAHDLRLGREVAKKVLLDDDDPALVRRFEREARLTGRLEHPNIPPVHDLGVDEVGRRFFTMKVVEGDTLSQILDRIAAQGEGEQTGRPSAGIYTLPRLLQIFIKACDAVAFAHSRGVVHRDLKPDNVMVGAFGEVLVMDWGLAKVHGTSDLSDPPPPGSSDAKAPAETDQPDREVEHTVRTDPRRGLGGERAASDQLDQSAAKPHQDDQVLRACTMDGQILGTPAYMPPEQATGKLDQIDRRSDVYSLGAILYELLTLQPPVMGETVLATLSRASSGDIEAPTRLAPHRSIPRELEAIAMKALSKNKRQRYQDVPSLADDIQLYLDGRTVSAVADPFFVKVSKWVRRNRALSAGLAGAGVVALLLVWFLALAPGSLTIRCNVEGSSVEVDGRRLDGGAPIEAHRLWPGQYLVLVKADRFEPASRTVRVRPGRASVLDIQLENRFGSLDVVTVPAGARLFIDGDDRGATPVTGADAKRGPRRIRIEKDGFETIETWVDVEAGSTSRIEKALEHLKGTVDISCSTPEVTVTLHPLAGGDPTQLVTNVRGASLNSGEYRAKFSKINFFPVERTLRVRSGVGASLHVELKSQVLWGVSSPSAVQGIRVADVDRDGDLEIVVSSQDSMKGGIITCRSLSTFTERWAYRQEDYFSNDRRENRFRIRLADLDRDGVLDVVATGPKNVFVLDGATGFRRSNIPLHSARTLTLADLNGDGYLDALAGTSYQGVIALDLKAGARLWRYHDRRMDYVQTVIVVEDVDGDRELEVVFGCRDGSLRCLGSSDGAPKWIERKAGVWKAGLLWTDVDGDGRPELSLVTREGRLCFFEGRGGGLKAHFDLGMGFSGAGLPLDLNRDGTRDFLAISGNHEIGCMTLSGGRAVRLWSFREPGAILRVPLLADLDGDGDAEVVILAANLPLVLVLDVKGSEVTRFRTDGIPNSLEVADLDDDGVLELVVSTEGAVTAFRFRSHPNVMEIETGHPQDLPVTVADFDGDGGSDFLFCGESGLQAWDGKTLERRWATGSGEWQGSSITAADLDGDGIDDLVVGRGYHNEICALDGKTGRVLWELKTEGAMYTPAAVADVDGDGKADVVAISRKGELFCLSGLKGEKRWQQRLGSGFHTPLVYDVDGDGRLEVVANVAMKSALLFLDATTGRVKGKADLSCRPTTYTTLCDVDKDGSPELFHGSFLGLFRACDARGKVVWEKRYGRSAANCRPLVHDVDGDGRYEVVYSVNDGTLYCLDADTGRFKWSGNVDLMYRRNSFFPARLCGEPSLFCFNGRGLVVLDGKTGRTKLSLSTFGTMQATPAVHDFDGDRKNDLIAFGAKGTLFIVRDFDGFARQLRRPLGPVMDIQDRRDPLLARRIHRLCNECDFEGLTAVCREALALGPGYRHLRAHCQGRMEYARSRWREAERRFQLALGMGSRIPELSLFLAGTLLHQRKTTEAEKVILDAIDASVPRFDDALNRYRRDLGVEIPALVDRLLEEDRDRADPTEELLDRYGACMDRGEEARAWKFLVLAVRYGKRSPAMWSRARDTLEREAEKRAMDTIHLFDRQGPYRFLDEAIGAGAGTKRIFFLRSYFAVIDRLGREEVRRYLDRALAEDPDYAPAVAMTGMLLEEDGKIDEAVRTYDKALRLDPAEPLANYCRALHFLSARRVEEAILALERALHFPPYREDALERLARLRGGR